MAEYEAELPLRNMTLLLADDETRLRQIVGLMLEELGARVISVDNCEKAVEIYRQRQEEIDILLLDLRMSGMGGEEAFRIIKEFAPDAPIVLSSGVSPDGAFLQSLRDAGCDFIEKPFDMDKLGRVLFGVARRQHDQQ